MSKNQCVLYLSQYGSSKTYADKAASLLDLKAIELKKTSKKSLNHCSEIMYFSSIRMNKIRGLKTLDNRLKNSVYESLVICAVGLSDDDEDVVQSLNTQIQQTFSGKPYQLHVLPGNFNVHTMNWFHRRLFGLLKSALSKNANKTNKEERLFSVINTPYHGVDTTKVNDIVNPH